MNQVFTFNATVYKSAATSVETVALRSSGSTETRARRRVLDQMLSSGLMVRKLVLVDRRPAKGK